MARNAAEARTPAVARNAAVFRSGPVRNGNFETGTGSASSGWIGSINNGWSVGISSGTATASYDNTVSHSGSQSMKYNSTVSGTGSISITAGGTIAGNITDAPKALHVIAGQQYKFSYWLKTDSIVGVGTRMYVWERNATGGAVVEYAVNTEVTGTNDWQYLSKTVTMNANTKWVLFILQSAAMTGTAWFDDISLITARNAVV